MTGMMVMTGRLSLSLVCPLSPNDPQLSADSCPQVDEPLAVPSP